MGGRRLALFSDLPERDSFLSEWLASLSFDGYPRAQNCPCCYKSGCPLSSGNGSGEWRTCYYGPTEQQSQLADSWDEGLWESFI